MRPQQNPGQAPNYQLTRYVTAADNATSRGKNSNGIHGHGYKKLLIQVLPLTYAATPPENFGDAGFAAPALGTSNPTIVIRYWCPVLQTYILHQPTVTVAAAGVGIPVEFEVDTFGRDVMIEITGGITASEGVAIMAAAADAGRETF